MNGIELVVTDLDGTFWHTDAEVHPEVLTAVAVLEARGVPLLVATGRRHGSTRRPLARHGLTPPAVVLNGALGLDLGTGRRFHQAPFPTEQAVTVLAGFRAEGLDPCVYVADGDHEVVLSTTPSTNDRHVEQLAGDVEVGDLDEVVATRPVLAFALIGVPHPPLARLAEAMAGVCEVHLDRAFDFPGLAALTAAPFGQSKWDGVLAYCRLAGLDPHRVLALADGPNDLELLTGAAVGLVPRNGHPAALQRADHLIDGPAEGGWAAVLDHL